MPTRASGTRLGPYEILGALGAGGMGEVYRARDSRLNRSIAIKILPRMFSQDPERLARFKREAQLLASLSHPNIAIIFGLEEQEAGAGPFLVMELVEGDDLSQRIARGPIPIDEAMPIAKQIADALETAHEQGIVHRDLKPANVKVRPDGTVKVLDFGLAKLADPVGVSAQNPDLANSPTMTSPAMTQMGMILGTAAYMAPEQARGRPVDKRADIWAFGCVLYEMLTGVRPFKGDELTDVIAAIVRDEPDWEKLPPQTPPAIHAMLRGMLKKNPRDRVGDMSVARFAFDAASALGSTPVPAGSAIAQPPTSSRRSWMRAVPWAASAVLALVAAAAWMRPQTSASDALDHIRMKVEVGNLGLLRGDVGSDLALSRDGRMLALTPMVGNTSKIFVRRLDQLDATLLEGTGGAMMPFFSPDGTWIGYFAAGMIYKIPTTGGSPVALCEAPEPRGASWGDDGAIVFGTRSAGLKRVPESGGRATDWIPLVAPDVTLRWPDLLPGARGVLFTSSQSLTARPVYQGSVVVQQAGPNGARKVLVDNGYFARYWPSGHLTYVRGGTLYAVPFDLENLVLTGEAVPVVQHIVENAGTGSAQVTVSNTGILAYVPGTDQLARLPIHTLTRDGTNALLSTAPPWSGLLFSPGGDRLIMDALTDGTQRDVYAYEPARDTLLRMTFDPADDVSPVWSPDGRKIAFGSRRDGGVAYNLFWQNADGSGDVHRLTHSPSHQIPGSWHPSGRFIVYHEIPTPGAGDLMVLPLEGSDRDGWTGGKPFAFLQTPATELAPAFSPDGHWIAYGSNETREEVEEVYVRPFPGPGGKWQVSNSGGVYATWSAKTKELLYESPDQRVMIVPYTADGEVFRLEKPQAWPNARLSGGQFRRFTVHPNGDLLATGLVESDNSETSVTFVLNVFDEVKRLTGVGR